MPRHSRTGWCCRVALVAVVVSLAASLLGCSPRSASVKVGILHSLTGTMAISETSLRDAVQMAIEEINAAGGVLGRPIEPVVADGGKSLPVDNSGLFIRFAPQDTFLRPIKQVPARWPGRTW